MTTARFSPGAPAKHPSGMGWLPPLSIFFAIIIARIPLIGFYGAPTIDVAFAALAFWLVRWPHLLQNRWVFLLGCLVDGLSASPFGLHALLWLLMKLIIKFCSRWINTANIVHSWIWFILLAAIYQTLLWITFSALHAQPLPAMNITWLWLSTSLAYPAVYLILSYCEQPFTSSSRSFSSGYRRGAS